MIQAFPELQALFRLESFDQERLEDCIQLINNIYPDKYKNRMAHSLLKMELLKYQISGGKKKWLDKSRKINNKSLIRKSFNGKNKTAELIGVNTIQNNVHRKNTSDKKELQSQVNWTYLVNKKVSEIAKNLDISLDFFLRYLKKKGLKLTPNQRLTFKELSEIENYVVNRLVILNRLKKNKSRFGKSSTRRSSVSAFKGVWGQMRKFGAPGKIIYIRSR